MSLTYPTAGTTAYDLLTSMDSIGDWQSSDGLHQALAAGIIQLGNETDELQNYKDTLQASTDELGKDNALSANWQLRLQILQMKWPTDPNQQLTIIADLQADMKTALPPDPPAPPATQLTTIDQINVSKATAQKLLDDLTSMQSGAVADMPALAGTDSTLAQTVGQWLSFMGINVAADGETAQSFVDSSGSLHSYNLSDLETPWSFSGPGLLVAEADYGVLGDGSLVPLVQQNGTLPTYGPGNPIPANVSTAMIAPADLQTDLQTSQSYYLFKDPGTGQEYAYPAAAVAHELLPDNLGANTGGYWSDGTRFYQVDALQAATSVGASLRLPAGAITFSDPGQGVLGALIAKGIPGVSQVSPIATATAVTYASNQAQAKSDQASNYATQWTSTAQDQQIGMQQALALFGNFFNFDSNAVESIEKMLTGIAATL